jgi:hypothetical protein
MGTSELYGAGAFLAVAVVATAWALERGRERLARNHRFRLGEGFRRGLLLIITLLILALGIVEVYLGGTSFGWFATPGIDFGIYLDATARVVHGGGWFLDRQLHGPYELMLGDVLYPPSAALLMLPFLVLPAALWWLIPIALVAWLVASWRPAPATWPLMALCLVWPLSAARIITGNPAMWLTLFVAAGLRWRWPAALLVLKPTLAPLALLGVRSRAWWVLLITIGLATVLMPDGIRYPTVLLDTHQREGWLYGVVDFPILALPVVAWLGRVRAAQGFATDADRQAGSTKR